MPLCSLALSLLGFLCSSSKRGIDMLCIPFTISIFVSAMNLTWKNHTCCWILLKSHLTRIMYEIILHKNVQAAWKHPFPFLSIFCFFTRARTYRCCSHPFPRSADRAGGKESGKTYKNRTVCVSIPAHFILSTTWLGSFTYYVTHFAQMFQILRYVIPERPLISILKQTCTFCLATTCKKTARFLL